jgi:hypothetical protein
VVEVVAVSSRTGKAAGLAASVIVVGLALSHVLGRFWWNDVVFALNGWYTPYDLAVFLRAGDAVLAGHSPYPDPATFAGDANYVYPPPLALVMTPFSALPERYAVTLFMVLSIAAFFLALRLFGVRDWRCYVLAFFFPVVQQSFKYGSLGSFLTLLIALLWHYRDRASAAGASTAGAVVLKLFLWPLALWLMFTRRLRAGAVAVVVGAGLAFASWAAIGFAGLVDYPRLLGLLADEEADSSLSVVAIGRRVGLPQRASDLLALACGTLLLALAARAARSERLERFDQDRVSLMLVLAASLALTPIVWLHYLCLLVVPIALARPRLSPLWFAPFVLWPMLWRGEYGGWPNGDIDALTVATGLAATVFVFSLKARRPRPRPVSWLV